jgi:organic radical activating enzyme
MDRFNSILISITEECNVGCSHCGYKGTASRRKATAEELCHWLEEIKSAGINHVLFTGGEPFFTFDLLKAGVKCANELAITTAIFTSCNWGDSIDNAAKTLEQLPGIKQLYLSTDKFHQEHVPVQYVKNVINAGLKHGIKDIMICITCNDSIEFGLIKEQFIEYNNRIQFFSGGFIPTKKFTADSTDITGEKANDNRCWIANPLLNPDGRLFLCHIGKAAAHDSSNMATYFMGDLNTTSLSAIIDNAENRKDYQFLRLLGPKGLRNMLKEHPFLEKYLKRTSFNSSCDLCVTMLSSVEVYEFFLKYINQDHIIDELEMIRVLGRKNNCCANQ